MPLPNPQKFMFEIGARYGSNMIKVLAALEAYWDYRHNTQIQEQLLYNFRQVAAWEPRSPPLFSPRMQNRPSIPTSSRRNIILRSDGLIKVLDFGLAQNIGVDGGIENLPLGSIGYM